MIVILSLIFKQYAVGIPAAFVVISIISFFISFVIGGWEGMGVAAVSISLFVASAFTLIITTLFYKLKSNHKH